MLYYKTLLVSGSLSSFFMLLQALNFFSLFPIEFILAVLIMHTHSLFPEIQNSSLVPQEKKNTNANVGNFVLQWQITFIISATAHCRSTANANYSRSRTRWEMFYILLLIKARLMFPFQNKHQMKWTVFSKMKIPKNSNYPAGIFSGVWGKTYTLLLYSEIHIPNASDNM